MTGRVGRFVRAVCAGWARWRVRGAVFDGGEGPDIRPYGGWPMNDPRFRWYRYPLCAGCEAPAWEEFGRRPRETCWNCQEPVTKYEALTNAEHEAGEAAGGRQT